MKRHWTHKQLLHPNALVKVLEKRTTPTGEKHVHILFEQGHTRWVKQGWFDKHFLSLNPTPQQHD